METRTRQEKGNLDTKALVKQAISELFAEEHFIEIITQKIISKVIEKLNQIDNKIKGHEEKITTLEKKIEYMQQNVKIKNICIYGVNENKNKDLKQLLLEVINEKMQTEIAPEDIDMCYRIGEERAKGKKPRPVIVKFKNYDTKHFILRNCSKFKGSQLFVMEDLIKPRQELLREAQEKLKGSQVWSYNGTVYVKVENKNIKINGIQDIHKYIST